MDNIRAVLFDLDGTIYYGSKLIPGADRAVPNIVRKEKRFSL